MSGKAVTVVVPFLNEAENLPELYERLKAVFAGRNEAPEFLFVDDGSTDGGFQTLEHIIMDADLQDPPKVLPELIANWDKGFEVVYAVRRNRDGDGLIKTSVFSGSTSAAFSMKPRSGRYTYCIQRMGRNPATDGDILSYALIRPDRVCLAR